MYINFTCTSPDTTLDCIQKEVELIKNIMDKHFPGKFLSRPSVSVVKEDFMSMRISVYIPANLYLKDVLDYYGTDEARLDTSKADFVNEVIDMSETAWRADASDKDEKEGVDF